MLDRLLFINLYVVKVVKVIVVVLLVAMTVFTFSDVLTRFIGLKPFMRNSEELVRFCLIWLTFFGAVLVAATDDHPKLSYFIGKIPEKFRVFAVALKHVAVYVYITMIIGVSYLFISGIGTQLSQGLRLPIRHVYLAIPIGMLLFGLVFLPTLITDIFDKEKTN